jgi:hypothetical protein
MYTMRQLPGAGQVIFIARRMPYKERVTILFFRQQSLISKFQNFKAKTATVACYTFPGGCHPQCSHIAHVAYLQCTAHQAKTTMDNTTRSPRTCARVITRGSGRKTGASSYTGKRLSFSLSAQYNLQQSA